MRTPRLFIFFLFTSVNAYLGFWLNARLAFSQEAPSNADRQTNAETEESWKNSEAAFLSKVRQLTFEGVRAGEGYFSHDGKQMVFQSEREPGNPFYQIYLMDRESGDTLRVSPGHGKTSCAWIHPDGQNILFASTQFDPLAFDKQKAELDFRASGKTKRYSWDYDETYDLVVFNRQSNSYSKLTQEQGYDAEGSYSPDGKLIAFSSNRRAYSNELTEREKELFKIDPASALDLYVMNSDGSNVRRITDVVGYDGGPFFSPDGKRICWRRFAENGAQAEIYSANVDGSDVRCLTKLGVMSWAPFYHPSGDYLIFTTNLLGFDNFELYVVDTQGSKSPIRITHTKGFDGLPAFTPDGKSLSWTSNRTQNEKSQIFIGQWNDEAVRKALDLSEAHNANLTVQKSVNRVDELPNARENAQSNLRLANNDFSASDIVRHVDYLCRPELGGRLTGTPGEKNATAYVAAIMEDLGLEPAGANRSFFQAFPFTASIELGTKNTLTWESKDYKANEQWRPIVFSKTGAIESKEVVFAGYGLVAAKDDKHPEYDSYVHLDVEGKWVLVFRNLPMDITPERRQHLARAASLRYKAMVARDRGAVGLIVVSGPTSQVRQQLVPLHTDGALSGSSIAAISVTDELAKEWLASEGEDIAELQKALDSGEMMMGIPLKKVKLASNIDVQHIKREGRNVLGRLVTGSEPKPTALIIGAHIDHLGQGSNGNSLAREDERDGIHRGADDNASGVAGMLEIAQYLAQQKKLGLPWKHDVILAAWSGEELGLIGSSYYADNFEPKEMYPSIIACLNLDMIGRLRDKLVVQGIGSSTIWPGEIERRNAVVGLDLTLQNDSYLPTDASTFFMKGVPILSAFSGQHSEYHTPRDVPELLNYEGAAQTSKLFGLIARSLAMIESPPPFVPQKAPENQGTRANMTAYLGTIPDYTQGDLKGVKLAGVTPGAPAAEAGVQAKDVIVELAGKKIDNVYDYTYAIEALRVGQETEIVIRREQEEIRLKITPKSRQ
jgi:Tol biopolymer transport system component